MIGIDSVILVCAIGGAPSEAKPVEKTVEETILEEVRALRRELDAVKRELDDLKSDIAEMRGEAGDTPESQVPDEDLEDEGFPWPFPPDAMQSRREADEGRLRKIPFPKELDEASVRAYIREIRRASRGQNVFGTDDPQVSMLVKLGSRWLPVLIDELRGSHMDSLYLNTAISRLATEEHKSLILDNLGDHKELAAIILRFGWEEDARETLIDGLEHGGGNLPEEWIRAVAVLRDPETYPALKRYMPSSFNPASVYRAIQDLPGIDLTKEVEQAWQSTTRGWPFPASEWTRTEMAKIAVGYGHADALEYLVGKLSEEKGPYVDLGFGSGVRSAILEHTEARGSNRDIEEWYKKHKSRLVFDDETRRFVSSKEV